MSTDMLRRLTNCRLLLLLLLLLLLHLTRLTILLLCCHIGLTKTANCATVVM